MRTCTATSGWLIALLLAGFTGGCTTMVFREPPPQAPEPAEEQARVGHGVPPRLPDQRWPPGSPGNPPFYDVMGKRYFVLPDAHGFREQGVASWYGREFHGRRTSSGEPYDMYALTAAHRTLPLPTLARVTNLETGKSIVLRINDRGPFRKERVMDLSYAAARELGILNAGTGLVEIEAIEDATSTTPAAGRATRPPNVFLQVGAFAEQRNAENLRLRLQSQGIANVVIRHDDTKERVLYRVRVGPVANAEAFDELARRVQALNLGSSQLVVESADETAGAVPPAPGS